jgi:hypothetical protein
LYLFLDAAPEFDHVTPEAKDLVARILKPADKRITLEEIFAHPWMNHDIPTSSLKVSFRKMHEYSKFSKVPRL